MVSSTLIATFSKNDIKTKNALHAACNYTTAHNVLGGIKKIKVMMNMLCCNLHALLYVHVRGTRMHACIGVETLYIIHRIQVISEHTASFSWQVAVSGHERE